MKIKMFKKKTQKTIDERFLLKITYQMSKTSFNTVIFVFRRKKVQKP